MDTIEMTVKSAPLFKGKAWRKQIEFVQRKFDEALLHVAFSKDGMQQLYVFEDSIYVNDIKGLISNNETQLPLNNISSVACNSSGLFAEIILTGSNVNLKISDVSVGIAQEVARAIQQKL